MARWRSTKGLAHDAVDATVELVRAGQESSLRSVLRVTDAFTSVREPARAIGTIQALASGGVLDAIKMVNRTVQKLSDLGLDGASVRDSDAPAVALASSAAGTLPWFSDAATGVVNAAVGDYLSASHNGLDMSMVLRVGERYLAADSPAFADAIGSLAVGPKVAVFVHGLGTTEWSWCLDSERYHGDAEMNFASMLTRDLGFTCFFVRYNTGRHVSENGRSLSHLLAALVAAIPSEIGELSLFGHSMGGLVAHAACLRGEDEGLAWPSKVERVFYLGSPHAGAPLAKLGHLLTEGFSRVDHPATQILSRLLGARSAGVQDLRHGALAEEDWLKPHPLARDSLPLAHATHHFITASVTKDPMHPLGRLIGDLIVRTPSASAPAVERTFSIDTTHFGGVLHHQLQNHPSVYGQIRRAFEKS